MYFYLYDSFLQDKKYTQLLTDIEARLIDLSIQGRTSKLNILNNMRELIMDAIKHGAETIVILGGDKSVNRAIHALINLDVTLGIIPIGNGTHKLAEYFGIPIGVKACDVLSKRVKEYIDVAKVNGTYFAFYLKALSPYVKIIGHEGEFVITPLSSHAEVMVCNFKPQEFLKEASSASFFNPGDGRFELVITTPPRNSFINKFLFKSKDKSLDYTILPFSKIRIEANKSPVDVKLQLDLERIIKPPVDIEVIPKKVRVIVGKERQF